MAWHIRKLKKRRSWAFVVNFEYVCLSRVKKSRLCNHLHRFTEKFKSPSELQSSRKSGVLTTKSPAKISASLTNWILSINLTLSCNIIKTCEGVISAVRLVKWSKIDGQLNNKKTNINDGQLCVEDDRSSQLNI